MVDSLFRLIHIDLIKMTMIFPVLEIVTALNKLSVGLIDNSYVSTVISSYLSSLDKLEMEELWKQCRKVGFILEDAELIGLDNESKTEIETLCNQLNSIINEACLALEVSDYLRGLFDPNKVIGIASDEQMDIVLFKEVKSDYVFACLKNKVGDLLFCRKFNSLDDFEEAAWEVV